MAHAGRDMLRQRYDYRCGYCGVSETDVGGELTVDHWRPLAAGGDERGDNLVYACVRCNQYKGGFFPSSDDLAHGWRVLHPLNDALSTHVHENRRTGELEPLTATGRFHIALLQLNRPALLEHRLRRRLAELLAEKQRLSEAENAQLRGTITAQEAYITHLRLLLGLPPQE